MNIAGPLLRRVLQKGVGLLKKLPKLLVLLISPIPVTFYVVNNIELQDIRPFKEQQSVCKKTHPELTNDLIQALVETLPLGFIFKVLHSQI